MDIQAIKDVVNSDIPVEVKESQIIRILSNDDNVIPHMLSLLEDERNRKRNLILDSNVELSRALIVLNDSNLKYNESKIVADPKWVVEQIKAHYIKWQNYIRCNFNIKGLYNTNHVKEKEM